jgi:hypothetical protein
MLTHISSLRMRKSAVLSRFGDAKMAARTFQTGIPCMRMRKSAVLMYFGYFREFFRGFP